MADFLPTPRIRHPWPDENVRQEIEPLALHGAAPAAEHAPYLKAQVNEHLAVGKIARLTLATIVPAHAHPTALPADRFFERRRRVRILWITKESAYARLRVENLGIDMRPTDAVVVSFCPSEHDAKNRGFDKRVKAYENKPIDHVWASDL